MPRKFDDATAALAGEGLLTEAFAVLSEPATHKGAQVRTELVSELAAAPGTRGMVGGQIIDMSDERADLDLDGVSDLQRLKIGALILFACEVLRAYARDLSLAFQIADDLLDAETSATEVGKPTGRANHWPGRTTREVSYHHTRRYAVDHLRQPGSNAVTASRCFRSRVHQRPAASNSGVRGRAARLSSLRT